MRLNIKPKAALAALALMASGITWSAGFLEREIFFSEADIQAQVEKSGTLQKSYGNGMIIASLIEPPRIYLGPHQRFMAWQFASTSRFRRHLRATLRRQYKSFFSGQASGQRRAVDGYPARSRTYRPAGHHSTDDCLFP